MLPLLTNTALVKLLNKEKFEKLKITDDCVKAAY